jgi:hypothetical protein
MDQRTLRNIALLPPEAARKLQDIQVACAMAQDLARASADRISNLPADATELRERLSGEQTRHAHTGPANSPGYSIDCNNFWPS